MPISTKLNIDYGDIRYIKNDYEQFPHTIVGIVLRAGGKTVVKGKDGKDKEVQLNHCQFILSYMGEEVTVNDFETATEPSEVWDGMDKGDSEGED